MKIAKATTGKQGRMMEEAYFEEYSSSEDAISTLIIMSGMPPKEMASQMWPDVPLETAQQRLRDKTNPNKQHKFTIDELKDMQKISGRADVLYWLCDQLSFERPVRKTIEKEFQELKEGMSTFLNNIDSMMKDFHKISRQMDSVKERLLKHQSKG
jgi:hypothetical protein